jgi:hypothetical protein
MVFDVESVGLHGEGFAVGWVVVDRSGKRYDEGRLACPVRLAAGSDDGRAWVEANIPPIEATHPNPRALRDAFWGVWHRWVPEALLVADCGWPVEAHFLIRCVEDDPANREWGGPYPLHDLASVMLAAGLDPLRHSSREGDELPEHDPLADARQAARLLLVALGGGPA